MKFNSKEMKKEVESQSGEFMRFQLGIPVNIEVDIDQDVTKTQKEFEEGKPVDRYELKIKVDGEEKIWSCSSRVLGTINEYIMQTSKFKIVRKEMNYDVIPLGISE